MVSVKAALERALRTSRKLVAPGDRVFVAVSGGKDSAVALYVLRELQKTRPFELRAFHIDLGLTPTLGVVEDLAGMLGVQLHTVSLRDYGIDIPSASRALRRPPCSVCGAVKRYLMNKVPRELGATKVATGHNADDILAFFLKDLAQGRVDWAAKLKPIVPSTHPKLLPKIRPLFEVTGEEALAIAESQGLPFTRERCPLAPLKGDWLQPFLQDFALRVEEKHPGFRLQLVRGIAQLPVTGQNPELRECRLCGEPTSKDICDFCRIRIALHHKSLPSSSLGEKGPNV